MGKYLLKLDNVSANYGKRSVLRGLSFTLSEGEIVALLGENGAGKSTLLRLIAGLLMPLSGRIEFQGRDITNLGPRQRQGLGLCHLIQGGRVFPSLTVEENYLLALRYRPTAATSSRRYLGGLFPSLKDLRHKRAGLLSGGQRQMLSIEMASQQCGVIGLWDEPTAGLSADNVERVLNHIVEITEPHMAQLVVEQRPDLLTTKVTKVVQIDDLITQGDNRE